MRLAAVVPKEVLSGRLRKLTHKRNLNNACARIIEVTPFGPMCAVGGKADGNWSPYFRLELTRFGHLQE